MSIIVLGAIKFYSETIQRLEFFLGIRGSKWFSYRKKIVSEIKLRMRERDLGKVI